ncbi:MAG: metal ABC transporter substrate-binding protein [Alphaproteobacteria bacterium]
MRNFLLLLSLSLTSTSAMATTMVISSRPLFDMINQVKTDDLQLHLIAQNSDTHSTDLLPKDKLLINESDALLAIEPFDVALIKAAQQLDKKVIVLNDLSEHILPIRLEGHNHEHEHEDEHNHEDHEHNHEDDHGHEHSGDDPHFWLSPVVVQDIIAYLSKQDGHYIDDSKYHQFLADIRDYQQRVTKEIQPHWIVYHDGWQYLENYFGFAAPLFFTQNPQGLIRPDDYKKVQTKIKDEHIRCIIIEPQTPKRVASRFKEAANIEAITLDPTGRTAPKNVNSLYWIWDSYITAAQKCSQ